MTKRYLGNIITQNPTAPADNLQGSAAKGVWSLEEQLAYQKAGLWPIPGNLPPDVTDVFSTYLYEGTGSAHTITNGIDLAGEGGLTWIKTRNTSTSAWHSLSDTERGAGYILRSDLTNAQSGQDLQELTSFNSNGFTVGNDAQTNGSGRTYASWTFRKAPKFFTCVTYTGDSNATQTVNHDLGSVPGMIIIKKTDGTSNWTVYHRSAGSYRLRLNTTEAQDENGFWATSPTDTAFTLSNSDVKSDGATYVAYLFAHNDGDGEFGPDGSDIIKCGSFTPDGSENATIDLGFEPQWFLVKSATGSGSWLLYDNMRGMTASGSADYYLLPNSSSAEGTGSYIAVTPTGIDWSGTGGGNTFIYMAIRRGPLAAPTAGTEVFDVDAYSGNSTAGRTISSGFPVDLAIVQSRSAAGDTNAVADRLRGANKLLNTPNSHAELTNNSDSITGFDFMDGIEIGTDTRVNWSSGTYVSWMWKRAPGFCDVVAYTGNRTGGASQVIPHNLTVLPEMIWVKNRTEGQPWQVYTATTGNTKAMYLDTTNGATTDNSWGNTSPTATNFTVGDDSGTNNTDNNFIAYLFASLPGISKVGSYTGNGGSQTIDCGFTSGARFVLIKDTTGGNWFVYDSVRGITSGSDPALRLNLTSAEVSTANAIAPNSSGFIVQASYFNNSGDTYIFYAIA